MLGDNDGFSLLFDQPQMLPQLADRRHIEIRRRLIQQIDRRVHRADRRKRDLLLFPAGEGKNAAAKKRFNAKRLRRFQHARAERFLWRGLVLQAKGNFAVGVDVKKLRARILKHAADLFRNAVHGKPLKLLSVKKHAPFQLAREKLRDEAVDKPRERRFAAAASAAQKHALPVGDGERDVFEPAARIRIFTRQVRGFGFSMPRVTEAMESSSAALLAAVRSGT